MMGFFPVHYVSKCIFIITLAVIASCNCAKIRIVANHIVKVDEEGFVNVTLPTSERIDYDVGETMTWTVLIDSTDYKQPLFSLQWRKNEIPIENYSFNDTNNEQKYEIANNSDHEMTFTIRNLSKSDGGMYQLLIIVNSSRNQQTTIDFALRIKDKPSFFFINTTSTVDEHKIGFVCRISSRPPIIGFTLPGRNQTLLSPKDWREIFNYDQETYRSASLNEEAAIIFFVQLPVSKDESEDQTWRKFKKDPRRLYRNSIDGFHLACITPNTNTCKNNKLNWSLRFSNKTHINLRDSSYIQDFKMVSLPSLLFGLGDKSCPLFQMLKWGNVRRATEGIYTVSTALEDSTLFNKATERKTASLAFKIRASTKPYMYNSSKSVVVVKEGDAATISCQAKGSPLPFITNWIKDGIMITNSSTYLLTSSRTELLVDLMLTISTTSLTDMGTYKCSFDNAVGVAEQVINLKII